MAYIIIIIKSAIIIKYIIIIINNNYYNGVLCVMVCTGGLLILLLILGLEDYSFTGVLKQFNCDFLLKCCAGVPKSNFPFFIHLQMTTRKRHTV